VMAFKDLIRQRPFGGVKQGAPAGGTMRLGQGFVDWPEVVATLKALKFDGPVSFHSEYVGEPVETVIDLARIDKRFFTTLWNA